MWYSAFFASLLIIMPVAFLHITLAFLSVIRLATLRLPQCQRRNLYRVEEGTFFSHRPLNHMPKFLVANLSTGLVLLLACR